MAKNDENKQAADTVKTYQEAKQLREEILSTEQRIADILKVINKLSSNEVKNAKELTSLIEKGAAAEKELVDLQDKSVKTSEKSVKMSKDGVFQLKEQRNLQEEMVSEYWNQVLDKQENQNKLQTALNQLEQTFQEEVSAANDSMGLLNDNAQKVLETTNYTDESSKKIQVAYSRSNELLKEQGSLSEKFLKSLQNQQFTVGEMSSLQSDVVSQIDAAAAGEYRMVDLTSAKLELEREMRSLKNTQNEMSAEEYSLAEDILKSKKDTLSGIEQQQDAYKAASVEAEKVLGVLNKVTSGDVKGALLQQFGLDDINKQLKEKVGGALVNVIAEVKKGNLSGAFSSATSGLKGMISMAPKLLAALGIGAILMLGNFLIDTFMEADKEVAQLGKDFGISKKEAMGVHHAAVDLANEMNITGVNAKEVAEGLKIASDTLGGANLAGKFAEGNEQVTKMVENAALLTTKFGMSGEEVQNLNGLSVVFGKSVDQMAASAQATGGALFSAKENMKILAGIPKSFALGMKGGLDAVLKTAQQAKLLGLNLKQVQDIGRKSLDIEQSLEAEMEARVLIGKDINLDKMREAALNNDQQTVMEEILKQAGSLKEFEDMTVIQREAMAKAMNMSVDEMTDMLTNQEKLNAAGLSHNEVQELQKGGIDAMNKKLKEGGSQEQQNYLKKLIAEKESVSTQEKMASMMEKLQSLAVKLVEPIMDLVDGFLQGEDGAAAMGGILDMVGGTIKMMVPGIKMIASIIGSIIGPLSSIFGLFGGTEEKTTELASTTQNVANGVQQTTEKVKPLLSGFGSLLGIVTTIGGLFAGKALLGKGLDMLKDKAADLGKTMMTKVGGTIKDVAGKALGKSKLGGLVKSGIASFGKKKSAIPEIPGIGDDVNKSVDTASGVADKAKSLGDKIADFGKGLGSAIKDIGSGIGKAIQGVLEGLAKGLEALGKGLATMTPIGPVVLVVSLFFLALAAALYIATPALKVIAPILITFATIIGDVLVAAIQEAGPIIVATLNAVKDIFVAFMPVLIKVADVIGNVLVKALEVAAPILTTVFEGIATIVTSVGSAISMIITSIADSIVKLAEIDGGKLYYTAGGIGALGLALAGLGASKAAEGFGSFVGSIFGGGDPMEKLISFTERIKAEKLKETANGLKALTATFTSFASALETMAASLDKLNLDKLDAAIEKLEEAKKLNDMSIGEGIASAASSFVGGITSIFSSPEKQSAQPVTAGGGTTGGGNAGGSKGGDKLDQVVSILTQILNTANQPTLIKFGDKTIEEIKTQLNFKKAYAISTDNTYGRSID